MSFLETPNSAATSTIPYSFTNQNVRSHAPAGVRPGSRAALRTSLWHRESLTMIWGPRLGEGSQSYVVMTRNRPPPSGDLLRSDLGC